MHIDAKITMQLECTRHAFSRIIAINLCRILAFRSIHFPSPLVKKYNKRTCSKIKYMFLVKPHQRCYDKNSEYQTKHMFQIQCTYYKYLPNILLVIIFSRMTINIVITLYLRSSSLSAKYLRIFFHKITTNPIMMNKSDANMLVAFLSSGLGYSLSLPMSSVVFLFLCDESINVNSLYVYYNIVINHVTK